MNGITLSLSEGYCDKPATTDDDKRLAGGGVCVHVKLIDCLRIK